MVVVKLHGRITEHGTLEVELPKGLPVGEVDITLSVMVTAIQEEDLDTGEVIEPMFTEEELTEMLTPNPVPAHLIQTGGWEHKGITDSVEWVAEQRRKRREKRRRQWSR